MKQLLLRQVGKTIQWMGRVFYELHLLEKLKMLPLLSPLAEAISLYGAAVESKANADFPESTEYSFEASPYHGVVVYEGNGLIHSITYWSAYADPGRDLAWMLKHYGEEHRWSVLNEGYLYQCDDGKVRLWCSAVPGIGVATADYLAAQAASKRQRKAAQSE